jgi:hypothetical protein
VKLRLCAAAAGGCETRLHVLEHFTAKTFAERVGETFRVDDGAQTIELELVDAAAATLRSGGRATSPTSREPFSIVFLGPPEPVLPQQTYRFEHDALDAFDLFIALIGPAESGMQYEAVFG